MSCIYRNREHNYFPIPTMPKMELPFTVTNTKKKDLKKIFDISFNVTVIFLNFC